MFGGHLGVGVTIPVGHIDLLATVTGPQGNTAERETSGWGLGDITTRAQLGWQQGTEPTSKLQLNDTFGITFNFENTVTGYKSGADFHFEWAIGREVCPGLVLGVAGYDYRQLTGDSGSGAIRF